MRLIEIRSAEELENNFRIAGESSIREQIHQNTASKQQYETLLDEIVSQFREQLGLSA